MYNLVDWTDRDVEHPRRFAMTENGDGTYTLTPQPGEIRREGTAYDAEHMNNLETGVDASVLLASFLFSLFSTGAENVVVSVEAKTLPPGSEATASLTTDAGGKGINGWRDDVTAESGGATSAFGISAPGGGGGGGCDFPGAGTGKGGHYINIQGTDGGNGLKLFGFGPFGGGGGGGSGAGGLALAGGAGGGGKGGRGGIDAVDGGDGEDGAANTGGGAGGAGGGWHEEPYQSRPGKAGSGGSGIVIIRGTQDDYIPVIFNGTQLDRIIYNGVTLTSLIYNGTKLYCRKFRRTIKNLITANIAESRKKAEYV